VQKKLIADYHERQTSDFWWFFEDEIKYAWQAIAEVIGAKLDYEYSLCSYSYTHLNDIDDDILRLKNNRAISYIYNNWIEPYLASEKTHKYRRDGEMLIEIEHISKISKYYNCPFTGTIYDNALMDAYKDFLDRFKLEKAYSGQMTVGYFVEILEAHMTRFVLADAEYQASDECAIEYLSAYEYNEEGEKIA
jgi:hypothetical protein